MNTTYSPRVKGSFALFTSGRSYKKIYLRITRLCRLNSYVITHPPAGQTPVGRHPSLGNPPSSSWADTPLPCWVTHPVLLPHCMLGRNFKFNCLHPEITHGARHVHFSPDNRHTQHVAGTCCEGTVFSRVCLSVNIVVK